MKNNYSLSGWIENLGVDPLLLLAALRLLPILPLRFSLLFFVTRVLETMIYPLRYLLNNCLNTGRGNLLFISHNVKIFVIITLFVSPILQAKTNTEYQMHLGEHKELKIQGLSRYLVSDKKKIKVHYSDGLNRFLVKAKAKGHAQIIYWDKDKNKEIIDFYISGRPKDLKARRKRAFFKRLGLSLNNRVLSGTIKTELHYQNFIASPGRLKGIKNRVKVGPVLVKQFTGKIYQQFYQQGIKSLYCENTFTIFNCYYDKEEVNQRSLEARLKKNYSIKFHQIAKNGLINYKIKFKVIQLERTDGEELSLGLEQIAGTVADFFQLSILRIIGDNPWFAKGKKLDLSTIAEPEIIVKHNSKGSIQLGSQIPYKIKNKSGNVMVQWKFAGLVVNITPKQVDNKIHLKYNIEFTRPSEDNISGSKESGEILVTPTVPIKLFSVTHKTEGNEVNTMPYLSKIPILGRLFTSTNDNKNYKRLYGLVKIEEFYDGIE